jgi:hypothetical protein
MVKRADWLSITPEPERELPDAVAALMHGGPPPAAAIARERARVELLVLHGSRRRWLEYLREVQALIDANAGTTDPTVAHARERAAAVISNHNNLMLALP